ncbi:MAG: DinB family protein [Leadbetterella sp.]|jgi:uncharacterized damage-inducible protein DinB|nr:DinB family protein [Leadbetterella sp.]
MDDLEYWLKGSVPEIPLLLQPVAHALLQVQKELKEVFIDFDEKKLWERPRNVASLGFHLNHLTGVLDRLFTYAEGNSLTDEQMVFLKNEGIENIDTGSKELLKAFDLQVIKSLEQLKNTNPETLTETRFVGRKMLPSTVIGLLFHAAEHTTRHFGQMLVTIKIL